MITFTEDRDLFRRLTDSAAAGSDAAFRQLFETYSPYVIRTVRRRLDRNLRSRFDSQDFGQSIWLQIYRRRNLLDHCSSPEGLIRLLVHLAVQKVAEHSRRHYDSERYNLQGHSSVDVWDFDSVLSERGIP